MQACGVGAVPPDPDAHANCGEVDHQVQLRIVGNPSTGRFLSMTFEAEEVEASFNISTTIPHCKVTVQSSSEHSPLGGRA